MPESLDAARILAPGREILDIFDEYVMACRVLGYVHHDLIRLHEWYDTEDGLDLGAIDTDQRALTAAARAAEQPLLMQDKQFRLAGDGWLGGAALAAREHMARHQTAAEQAVTALHTAAATLNRLREALCEALTRKVAATVQIEGRRVAQRAEWLAAARTVTAGVAGDRSAASELIDQEVRPFVADDIAGDWVAAMRSSTDAVADAYADAMGALRAAPMPMFGPTLRLDAARIGSTPAVEPRPSFERTVPAGHSAAEISWPTPPPAVPVAPAAFAAPPVAVPTIAADPPIAEAAPLPAAGQSAGPPGMGSMADPGLGTGLNSGLSPGVGSGLAGAGQQLADLFSGLIGSAAEGLPEVDGLDAEPDDELDVPDDLDEPEEEEAPEDEVPEEEEEEDEEDEELSDEEAIDKTDPEAVDEEPVEEEPDGAPEVVEPQEESFEPVASPPVAAESLAQPDGQTPCEIAADELPQVGS
jgi:hypothetical protein